MARSDNLTGSFLMMASMAAFVMNDMLMKMMAGDVPMFQLLFLRGVLTTVLVGLIVWWTGVWRTRVPRRDWGLIALRTAAEVCATFFFLTALFNMELASVTAILQALPITITLAAALFFKEPVGWRRLSAIAVGMIGVMLIIRPGAEDFTIYSLYGLAAVCCVTVRDLTTRRLSHKTPSMLVTFMTSICVMTFFGLAGLGDDWAPVGPREATLVASAALMIIGGYLFSVMVMRVGEISFVAPFRFTGLIWALLLGWLAFGEWPDQITLLGAAIVVGSGLFMLYREHRLKLKTAP